MIHRGLTPLLAAVAVVAAGAATAPATTALQAPQLEFPISLVAPGDAVEVGYDTEPVPGATGVLYVRNDLRACSPAR